MSESNNYYLLLHNEEAGPFSLRQLFEMLAKQEISPETLYARPGMSEWLTVASLKEESAIPAPAAKPVAPSETISIEIPQNGDIWVRALRKALADSGIKATVEVMPANETADAPSNIVAQPASMKPNSHGAPLTPVQLELLSRLPRRTADSFDTWQGFLGNIEVCIKSFEQMGLIQEAALPVRLDHKFRLMDLKPLLRRHGARVSGTKAALIQELIAKAGCEEAARLVADVKLFRLTAKGQEAVRCYEGGKQHDRARVEAEAMAALRLADVSKAGQIVAAYQAQQAFSRSTADTPVAISEGITKQAAYLLNASYEDLECDAPRRREVAVALALSALLGEGVFAAMRRLLDAVGGHFDCPILEAFARSCHRSVAARVFGEDIESQSDSKERGSPGEMAFARVYVQTKLAESACHESLHELRKSEVCKGVEILVSDGCPVCDKGKKRLSWAELESSSPLPRHWGCTCLYAAWLD